MKNFYVCTILSCFYVISSPVISNAAYPYQGQQQFKVDGTLTMVDTDRDRAGLTTNEGKQYDLDTQNALIQLRDTSKPVGSDRLIEGMHVTVFGALLSHNLVAVEKISVLPYTGNGVVIVHKIPVAAEPKVDEPFHLRGAVVTVDDQTGVIVVRVNNHTRSVFITHGTDLTDIHSSDDSKIGVAPGNRVTIVGSLRADGSVIADAMSFNKNIETAGWRGMRTASHTDNPSANDIHSRNTLFGQVTHVSDKYTSRDIKIRTANNDDITVHIPHDAKVVRLGKPISMHDLSNEDTVKVTGYWDGDDFKASSIIVDLRDDADY